MQELTLLFLNMHSFTLTDSLVLSFDHCVTGFGDFFKLLSEVCSIILLLDFARCYYNSLISAENA